MRVQKKLLCSPACLLINLLQNVETTQAQALEWPYNLPPHVKYYPENESLVRRDMDILERLQLQPAVGVKKMSVDPGEKFFLNYWTFQDQIEDNNSTWLNTSVLYDLDAPVALHADGRRSTSDLIRRYLHIHVPGYHVLETRDFVCPTGTLSCSSINRPNTCCPTTSTCQIVPDTGLGDVGCCDASQTCAGSLSNCPSGYSSCPNNPGGGCCLPGYACYQEGCVLTSTTTVVVQPSTSSTSTIPPSTATATSTVIVTPSVSTSISVSPTSSSPSSSSSTQITTTTLIATVISTPVSTLSNALVCSTGYRSCPASLGGGCCPTDRACGRDFCPEMTTSASLVAPVRPTTATNTVTSTTTSFSSLSGVPSCPTGFYGCSAYHQGGCCQVGRNCDSTSCPASASTTVVNTNGVTAVAPIGVSGQNTILTGSCATGWFSCASANGGGCCPSGYACGTAACSATASGGQNNQVGKIAPNGSSSIMNYPISYMIYGLFLNIAITTFLRI